MWGNLHPWRVSELGWKNYSVGSGPAGAGCWTRLWRGLPAGIFVIFFNILSSFYWSGKYFILTGYKSRLFLNIGWIYLLENSCLVCIAVESQVELIAQKTAVPGDESMGNHSFIEGRE